MSDTTTTNYGWVKPQNFASDDTWGTKINTDLDSQDATVWAIHLAVVAAQADATTAKNRVLHETWVTANGTFAIPAGTTASTPFEITPVGAGGGGGGCASNVSGTAAGGGGAGGVGYGIWTGFTAAQNITLTIGALGAGGTGGADGTAGGNTTVTYAAVAIMTATGGAGGKQGNTGTQLGGAAGAATETVGASGLTLISSSTLFSDHGVLGLGPNFAGAGGSGEFGTGGASVGGTPGNGSAASGYGAGGSGAYQAASAAHNGGAGTIGAVRIRYWL